MTFDKASEMFVLAACSRLSKIIECEFCGRVHLCPSEGDWDAGYLESMRKRLKDKPQRYIAHDKFIRSGQLGGKTWVVDCVCDAGQVAAIRTEQAWWRDRHQIVAYLGLRAGAMRTQTTDIEELAARGRATL